MQELKDTAIWYLERYVNDYQERPNERDQHDCQSRISFAKQLGLITHSEAAAYARRIGLEKVAETYEKFELTRLANAGMSHACGLYPQE